MFFGGINYNAFFLSLNRGRFFATLCLGRCARRGRPFGSAAMSTPCEDSRAASFFWNGNGTACSHDFSDCFGFGPCLGGVAMWLIIGSLRSCLLLLLDAPDLVRHAIAVGQLYTRRGRCILSSNTINRRAPRREANQSGPDLGAINCQDRGGCSGRIASPTNSATVRRRFY